MLHIVVEAPTRFELVHKSFADFCLTTWLRRHKIKDANASFINGAGYEARTRYLHLGKVALYQMS